MSLIAASGFGCTRYRSWEKEISRNEGGVAVHCLPREWGEGDTAVLLVHGFADGPGVWSELGPALAERGYRVRAMRLPGWGEPVEVKQDVTMEDWSEAIEADLAELAESHSRTVLAGHSLGGALSIVLAQGDDLKADALVLYAPMLKVSDDRSPLLETRSWFNVGERLLPERFIIRSRFGDHVRVAEPRPESERDPFSPPNIFRQLFAVMDAVEKDAPSVAVPLRLVMPGEDAVVSREVSLNWFERLSAPSKTLVEAEEAGHVLPLDLKAADEAEQVHLWIQKQGNNTP